MYTKLYPKYRFQIQMFNFMCLLGGTSFKLWNFETFIKLISKIIWAYILAFIGFAIYVVTDNNIYMIEMEQKEEETRAFTQMKVQERSGNEIKNII